MTTEQLTVSIENQEQANEKIPLLLQSPASTRILQIEPMLGPIDLKWCEQCGGFGYDSHDCYNPDQGLIDLVTISGQLGPNAQPMHPDWVRSIRDQCQAAGIPFSFKQWGEWRPLKGSKAGYPTPIGWWDKEYTPDYEPMFQSEMLYFYSGITSMGTEHMVRVGKEHAGRLLDGREWNETPSILGSAALDAGVGSVPKAEGDA